MFDISYKTESACVRLLESHCVLAGLTQHCHGIQSCLFVKTRTEIEMKGKTTEYLCHDQLENIDT